MPANLGSPLAPAANFNYAGEFAWANLPAASTASAFFARVTDFGVPFLWVYSDGTRWIPAGPQVLSRTWQGVSCGVDVTEDTLATINVPANLLGINGALRVRCYWTFTSSANNKTLRNRYSGGAGSAVLQVVVTTDGGGAVITEALIGNKGAANSQLGYGNTLAGVTNTSGPTVDTTAATTVVITGQKALNSETLTLQGYDCEVLP